jgi:ParB/RepB/Spo0J family partition protein
MGKHISNTEEFDPKRVRPLPNQPRKRFSGIKELAASIKEVGQSTPGLVTRVTDDPDFDAQLIDGERRLRACLSLGCPFRAEVKDSVTDAFAASFAANFGKQEHDAIEIAEALGRLREGRTIEQLAAIAGKSTCWVSQHLSLLKLHPDVQSLLLPAEDEYTAKLSFTVAILLTAVDHDRQLKLARQIVKQGLSNVAARRLVLREPDMKIDRSGSRRIRLDGIESILEDVTNRIGVYLDLPGSEINAMIDAAEAMDRRAIADMLYDAAGDLNALADAIDKRAPKKQNAQQRSRELLAALS